MMNIEDIDPEKRNDYEEVHNYIKTLDYVIDQILNGKLPFSSRLTSKRI